MARTRERAASIIEEYQGSRGARLFFPESPRIQPFACPIADQRSPPRPTAIASRWRRNSAALFAEMARQCVGFHVGTLSEPFLGLCKSTTPLRLRSSSPSRATGLCRSEELIIFIFIDRNNLLSSSKLLLLVSPRPPPVPSPWYLVGCSCWPGDVADRLASAARAPVAGEHQSCAWRRG